MKLLLKTIAIIVAAGRGERAQTGANDALPKQYQLLGKLPLMLHSIMQFAQSDSIDAILVVIHPEHVNEYAHAIAQLPHSHKLLPVVIGGDTRQKSVLAGLEALKTYNSVQHVLIHDAARPFISSALIENCINTLKAGAIGAIPALPVYDTLKFCENTVIDHTVDRANMYRAQTPQGFVYDTLYEAHVHAQTAGITATDDAALMEIHDVRLIAGDARNIKITHPQDWAYANFLLNNEMMMTPDIRTAQGFDIHRFKHGNHIILGGIRIPHTHGIEAHSDGDVILHALTDALLGLIADGDIGQLFPNTNPEWKNANSDIFVNEAMRRIQTHNGTITHCDISVLCEAPKLTPHRDAIRAHVAGLLHLPINRVALKATTMEKLGSIGRGEGLAAQVLITAHFRDTQ